MANKRVKCSNCNSTVGYDTEVSIIETCLRCHRKEKKIRTRAENFARVKKGPAPDLGKKFSSISFRSPWERNFARSLNKQKIKWEFESKNCKFTFSGYKRGPWAYLCDFYLPGKDIFVEVKGYFAPRDRSKFRRLKSQYPEAAKKLTVVLSKRNKKAIEFYKKNEVPMTFYEDLEEEWKNKIPAWE